jgi:hypothetical protein
MEEHCTASIKRPQLREGNGSFDMPCGFNEAL